MTIITLQVAGPSLTNTIQVTPSAAGAGGPPGVSGPPGPSTLIDQLSGLTAANNLVINGAMEIDQIAFGNAQIGISNTALYAIDMVKVATLGAQVISTQQISAPFTSLPPGFASALYVTVTTPNPSPLSTDSCAIQFPIEGYRCARLGFGVNPANAISIGFYVLAFRAGIYGLTISNGANNRSYSASFTIALSGVWQWVNVTVPGDITGTWGVTTGKGLVISIFMMSALGHSVNQWVAAGPLGTVGQANGVQTTSDYMMITGLCAFPGVVAPPVARAPINLPFQETLQQCYRYYQKSYDYTTALAAITTNGAAQLIIPGVSGVSAGVTTYFPGGPMATPPSITTWSTATGVSGKTRDGFSAADVTSVIGSIGMKGFLNNPAPFSGASAYSFLFHWAADARL